MINFIISYIYVLSGALLHFIAMKKGGGKINRIFWFTMGFYFGPLAIPFIILQKRKS